MTEGTPGSHLDLELLAAQLRRHSDDLSMYAGFLLNVLSAALPPELVQVTREGKWKAKLAGREPAVLGISVTIDDRRYELERSGGERGRAGRRPAAVAGPVAAGRAARAGRAWRAGRVHLGPDGGGVRGHPVG